MGLNVRTIETLAQHIAKFTKLEGKASVLFTKPKAFDAIKPAELKLATLKTDVVEITKPKKYNFDLNARDLSCSVSNSKIDEIFLSGCGRGCKKAHGIVDTEKFRNMTGMQLVVGDNINLRPFRKGVDTILHQIDEGIFPKILKVF